MWHFLFRAANLWPVKRRHFQAWYRYKDRLQGRVLDVGCGRQPLPMPDTVTEYFSLERVLSYGVKPSLQGDAMVLPFADEVFDWIVCTEVLEHIPHPQHALAEFHRVLKPGGQAYITTPLSWGLHYVPHDYYRFTTFGLTQICKDNQLTALDTFEMGNGIFSLISARFFDVFIVWCIRLTKPVNFLIGLSGRQRLVSLLFALPVLVIDKVAEWLDCLLPSADRISSGIIVQKQTETK